MRVRVGLGLGLEVRGVRLLGGVGDDEVGSGVPMHEGGHVVHCGHTRRNVSGGVGGAQALYSPARTVRTTGYARALQTGPIIFGYLR